MVKNSGSLSLDTFGARMTGDRILRNSKEEGNLRMFQDGLAGENIFKRDWWETRILLDAKVTHEPPVGRVGGELGQELGNISGSSGTFKERRTTPRGSPSSSASRSSTRGSTTSIRQSPVQGLVRKRSSSTTSDVIDVDSTTTTRGSSNKRKVAAIAVSDSEIEIIEGPVLTQKKTKGKAPTKAKNKKK
jgi:mediator of RNA polymerase II transcription subunit 12